MDKKFHKICENLNATKITTHKLPPLNYNIRHHGIIMRVVTNITIANLIIQLTEAINMG